MTDDALFPMTAYEQVAQAKAAGRKTTLPRGHVAPVGSGPAGETCGSCAHLSRRVYSKVYLKCALNRRNWTGGGGSDVRAKDAACSRWASPANFPTEEQAE